VILDGGSVSAPIDVGEMSNKVTFVPVPPYTSLTTTGIGGVAVKVPEDGYTTSDVHEIAVLDGCSLVKRQVKSTRKAGEEE
jgi:hypothetical protein